MDKANARRRALNQPLPGMNRTPSAESDNSDASFARRRDEVFDNDDDEPPQPITGSKRSAPASRRGQPPRGKRKRTIAESDGEGGDDDNDPAYKEGSDEESEEDEEPEEDEGASPSRALTRAPARAPARAPQSGAQQKERDMIKAMARNEAVTVTFTITSKKIAEKLVKAGVPAVSGKTLGPFTAPAWCSDNAMQLPQLKRECFDREEWFCKVKFDLGRLPRDKCKREGWAPPGKEQAQIFLCWWFDAHLSDYMGGENFPCAKPITDEQRAFSETRRAVSKVARSQNKAAGSNSNTALALPDDSDGEDGGGGGAHARATDNRRGRPEGNAAMLHKAQERSDRFATKAQALEDELATTKDELASANAVAGKRDKEFEALTKQIGQYQIELKRRGDMALDQNRLRQEQEQGAEAVKRSYAAAILEVCDADTAKRVQALVDTADEERKSAADAPWQKAELDVKAMKDATQVAWEAGAVALRTIAAAEQADGGVPEKANKIAQGLKEDVVEFQNVLRSTGGHTTRALNRIGEVMRKIKKKADKAAKKAAKAAGKKAVEANEAAAAQDSMDEQFAMETAAFAAQGGVVQPPEL